MLLVSAFLALSIHPSVSLLFLLHDLHCVFSSLPSSLSFSLSILLFLSLSLFRFPSFFPPSLFSSLARMTSFSLGDLPYLLQQRLHAARVWYATSSLFTKNLVFVGLGASLGFVVGKIDRKKRLAEGDLNRNVRVTFFSLLPPPSSSSATSLSSTDKEASPSATHSQEKKKKVGSPEEESSSVSPSLVHREARRSFEALWNSTARSMQRLPGYGWTQMYRLTTEQPHLLISSSSSLSQERGQTTPVQGVLKRNPAAPSSFSSDSSPHGSRREEPMASRPPPPSSCGESGEHLSSVEERKMPLRSRDAFLRSSPPPHYVQLRQWLRDEEPREVTEGREISSLSHAKGAEVDVQKPPLSSKKEGLYEILVDDSLVRIIQ
ncbi:hypothetical protein CSUI_001512 [Cystoisospora suis]|uniref:Uncharacterized protein n=1 Tax=Cystoisospora suis TaxID=483139 RepID=A0A2C6LCG4_9APIC|nr:hypothetical protein CSUI_001512 [Cystoisospora suis]